MTINKGLIVMALKSNLTTMQFNQVKVSAFSYLSFRLDSDSKFHRSGLE